MSPLWIGLIRREREREIWWWLWWMNYQFQSSSSCSLGACSLPLKMRDVPHSRTHHHDEREATSLLEDETNPKKSKPPLGILLPSWQNPMHTHMFNSYVDDDDIGFSEKRGKGAKGVAWPCTLHILSLYLGSSWGVKPQSRCGDDSKCWASRLNRLEHRFQWRGEREGWFTVDGWMWYRGG